MSPDKSSQSEDKMNSLRNLMAAVLFMAIFTGMMFAQGGATGAIGGVVQDASGAVIANARVSIKSEATGEVLRQVMTDASGLFTATLLPVGTYYSGSEGGGLSRYKVPRRGGAHHGNHAHDRSLKVGAVRQVVEVQSQVEQVNTTDATTGQSLGAQTITDLPLATRNFQQLLTLSAGASSDLNGAAQLGRGTVYMHVNGGREDNNNYLIDGITVADYAFGELTYTPLPSPDAIQEFKVSTSLYDATQGRNGGGNINATLKSGSRTFHGDLWEYFRNTDLDANDYFLGKVVVKQNIFGGDIGGPIGPGAKLGYFYFNLQGTRQRSGDSPGTYINSECSRCCQPRAIRLPCSILFSAVRIAAEYGYIDRSGSVGFAERARATILVRASDGAVIYFPPCRARPALRKPPTPLLNYRPSGADRSRQVYR